jgi:hypothetical protein
MQCLEMARDFKRRNPPRKTAPVVFQSRLDLVDVIPTEFGYSLQKFARKRIEWIAQNLTDVAQTIRPALALPAGMTAAGFDNRERIIPPGGSETLAFELTIDPSVEPMAFRMLRIVDKAGHAQPLVLPVRAWAMETVRVPAQGKDSAQPSSRPSPSLSALLAEKDWRDFSSPGYWLPAPGGSSEPAIKARFRTLSWTRNTLRIQVLVRDAALKLFDTPEAGIGGDCLMISIHQRNPDGSVRKRDTKSFYVFQCAAKADAPASPGKTFVMWYPAWRRNAKITHYDKSRLEFRKLDDNYYLYTIDIGASDFALDLKTGNAVGIGIKVIDSGAGFLSWGSNGNRDGRLFNCLKLE